jgi:hypothetical protein
MIITPLSFQFTGRTAIPISAIIDLISGITTAGGNITLDPKLVFSEDVGITDVANNLFIPRDTSYINRAVSYSASSSFVVPTGVTEVLMFVFGGGGGGGAGTTTSTGGENSTSASASGGNGGGGGVTFKKVSVTAGQTYTFTIGAGGAGGNTGGANGAAGGTSSILNPSAQTLISATGGGGGEAGVTSGGTFIRNGNTGADGVGSLGDLNTNTKTTTSIKTRAQVPDFPNIIDRSNTNFTYANYSDSLAKTSVQTAVAYTLGSNGPGSWGTGGGPGFSIFDPVPGRGDGGVGGAAWFFYYQD